MQRVEQYVHHDKAVVVMSHLKGKHRSHCLCFNGCKHFKPGQESNCPIAQDVFRNCQKHGIVSPVWECPQFAV